MRTIFIQTLCGLAERDPKIWLVCGDLGYSVLEPFSERFPDRFVNAGVAEQNMMGLAAGLAMSGKTVFVYSIVNFPVMRCLEQVRNDVCYHNLNVKIVAVGGGLAYGGQGYTHHGVEDLAVMRILPHMTVVAPGDPVETRMATNAVASYPGPCYLRLGRGGERVVHMTAPEFQIGRVLPIRPGSDITLASIGGILPVVLQAADELAKRGLAAEVLSVPTLSPLDEERLLASAKRTGRLITIEEHGIGGLGTAVAEVLAENAQAVQFKAIRLGRTPVDCSGTQDYLRQRHGLTVEAIVASALRMVQ